MKRTLYFSLLFLTVVALIWGGGMAAQGKKDAAPVIGRFYDDWIHEQYGTMHLYFDRERYKDRTEEQQRGAIAQSLIHDRWGYGDIRKCQIRRVLWWGADRRRASVSVTYLDGSGKEAVGRDVLFLVKRDSQWLIETYESGSSYRTMRFP